MNKSRSHANRGMQLEKKIDKANKMYAIGGGFIRKTYVASVHKVPTNVKIMSVNGPRVTGVKQHGEMVDYVGVMLGGHAIAFDAKETKGKSLPLANLHEHQYEFLERWYNLGATTFLVVYFKDEDKYFRLPFKKLQEAWKRAENGGRKSIPLSEFENELIYMDGILYYLEGL